MTRMARGLRALLFQWREALGGYQGGPTAHAMGLFLVEQFAFWTAAEFPLPRGSLGGFRYGVFAGHQRASTGPAYLFSIIIFHVTSRANDHRDPSENGFESPCYIGLATFAGFGFGPDGEGWGWDFSVSPDVAGLKSQASFPSARRI